MRRIVLGGLLAIAMGSPGFAADKAVRYAKAPVYTKAPLLSPQPAYRWDGFYVGAHVGLAASKDCLVHVSPPVFAPQVADTGCQNNSSAIGGGQIGFNLVFSQVLIGGEFSGSAFDLSGSHVPPPNSVNSNLTITSKSDHLYLLTGRAGVIWNGNILTYVKGGGAWTKSDYAFIEIGQPTIFTNASRNGYTIGGGVEFMFAPGWSFGMEYNRVNFDAAAMNLRPIWIITADKKIDIVTARLNYHFGSLPF
jgi:outer membrane immunogenic protein